MTGLIRCSTLLACFFLGGCAYGRFGTLVARQTLTSTAQVVEVYGFGVLVRPTAYDGGVSLGYRRATYIYPRLAGDLRPVGETMYWGWAPLRPELPFYLDTQQAGAEWQVVPGNAMIHAGLVYQSFSFVAKAEESRMGSFFYQRPHPERTILALRSEPEFSFGAKHHL